MQHLKEENDKALKQIKLLEDSVALNQKIDNIKDSPLLYEIIEGIEEADELIKAAKKLMNRDLANVRREYEKVMHDLRETQADTINYTLKIKKQKIEEEALKTPQQKSAFFQSPYEQQWHSNLSKSSQKQLPYSALKQVQLQFGDLTMTPKMSIKEYRASPLVKKVKLNVTSFDLLDFAVRITRQQFESIPKYMRGRTSCDELQHFLEYTIVQCFNEKYKLLHRTRAAVQHTKEYEIWKIYHSQITYVPGRNFITAGDISRKMQKMIDKKTQSFLVMIRHLGILQEERFQQTVCYIWTAVSEHYAH